METQPENKTKKKRIDIWPFKYLISNLKINPKKKKKELTPQGVLWVNFFPTFKEN